MVAYTLPFSVRDGDSTVAHRISEECPGFKDKIQVQHNNTYYDRSLGRAFYIRFVGYNDDPGQFEFVSDEDVPITGQDVKFIAQTVTPYGSNLFYEPIPFEMLKTYETKPQVIVNVNGLPAVCHNLTCDFTYTAAVGQVTAASFDESTKKVVIAGTELPSKLADIQSVYFALTECQVDESTLSSENVECTLALDPTCGDHLPIITSKFGRIPYADGLAKHSVDCSVDAITPLADLNLLGYDNITLTGKNFPHNLESSTIDLKFDDAQQTKCMP